MRTERILVLVVAMAIVAMQSGSAWAAGASASEERIRKLEAELEKVRSEQEKNKERMEALVKEVQKLKKEAPSAAAPKPTVQPRFDVLTRFASERFDNFINQLTNDREGVLLMRVRAHLDGSLGPNLDGGLQLTTAGNPNPTSPFIRLTGASTSKPFNLGRAYVNYHPLKKATDVNLTFGKMPNPFWRGDLVGNHNSELIWDDDVNPEGVSLHTPIHLGGKKGLKLSNTLGYFMINNPTEENLLGLNKDTTLLADQVVAEYKSIKLGVGLYDYQGLNSGLRARAFDVPADPNNPFGATFDVAPSTDAFLLRPGLQTTNSSVTYGAGSHGFVTNRFTTLNLTAQYTHPRLVGGKQLYFLFDGVHNYRVSRERNGTAYTIGGRSKNLDKVGSFNSWLTYRSVDADATLATFADSDLGQGTDYRGFELGTSLRIQPKTSLQISLFKYKQSPLKHFERTRLFIDIIRAF